MKNDYFAPVRVRSTSASTRTKSHLSACQISFGKGASVCKKIGHEYEEYDHCRYLPVQSHFSWYCTRTDSNTAALSENRLLSCTSTRTTSTRTVLRTVRNVTMSRYYIHMPYYYITCEYHFVYLILYGGTGRPPPYSTVCDSHASERS